LQTDPVLAAHTIRIYKPKYCIVTLKFRLKINQGHWKRNHWIDHTRLSSSQVIWHWRISWPWNVG